MPSLSLLLLLAALLGLAACAPTRSQELSSSVLPAAAVPNPPLADTAPAPPRVAPSMYLHATPEVLDQPSYLQPQPSPSEALIQRAEMLFSAGKLHYEAGEMAEARRLFDQAIDLLLDSPERYPGRPNIERKLSDLVEAIHRYDVAGLGAGETPNEPVYERSPLDEIPELTFPVEPGQRMQVADEVKATVSQLPLDVNDEVLRYIKYFSTGRGRRILIAGLKRAGRYRPLIRRILDEEGVPQELIHLAQAESGFSPRAISRKRASGMWQFMSSRAHEYGLERTRSIDDRFDPEKATRAAARHLRDLYTQFGDWYLAMAAYNCGPVNVQKAVERTGYADIWEIVKRNALPKETTNYIPIILAMTIMSKNPADYGLADMETDPPLEYSKVEIKSPTHLALVADITNSSVQELRELNPALLKTVAPSGYMLRVPKGTEAAVASALEMIPPAQRDTWRMHRVEEGETLAAIAKRYRSSEKLIAEVNQLNGEGPEGGNLLLIPTQYQASSSTSRRTVKRPATRRKTTSRRSSSHTHTSSRTASRKTSLVASKHRPDRSKTAQAR